ncbi:alkane 1-monooxygenase [Mycobacterium sp. PS03-16]|uniref:alkane 1-monooxygenase n=1 Tax=Mycobacterium sp. PS03-16 TaxID=2559611 RepID=UPI001073D400|nr:alkane 1-monooxygenase [Mycobacterium sp. PS03-16]TFV55203.1 alkane 1-monooxygenase [Mycobacterium sp. PS03-16]
MGPRTATHRIFPSDADGHSVTAPHWRDPKRYLWLFAAIVPTMVSISWFLVTVSGSGAFWWTAPVIAFVIIPVLDRLIGMDATNAPDGALAWLEHDPFYRWVTYLFLPSQYLSLLFACWLWAGGGWLSMSLSDKIGLMVTVGIIGGVAITTAHELGHRRERIEKRLSKIALAQTCYGHFFVEHNRGHHAKVATLEDPATSRFGESLYAFIPRSVCGSVRSAWRIERARFRRMGRSPVSRDNDVLSAWAMSAGLYVVLAVWFGPVVLPYLAGQAVIGFCLLETVNYLEHYGLRRQKLANGRYERVRACHSWNSNTVVANVFLFHLQRHSDHHAHPLRRYQSLRHADEAPQLPAGYATMILLALVPPLWRRVMDWRVIEHYGGDLTRVGLRPRAAARLQRERALSEID